MKASTESSFFRRALTKSKQVALQGFVPANFTNVIVTVGGQTPLDIQLSVGNATVAMVDVSAEGQVVETSRTSISSVVNERAIQNLPVNGRNFLDFATLTPSVVRDPTRQGDLAVGGQKGTLNSLQVDGADNNNTFFGQSFGRTGTRPPYQFSEESVQEFQVNQNGFSAEFGRAGGAVINVVTKSGTNDWHGSAFEFFRDEALNSNTPILTARNAKRPKSQINQFGATIGGPIKHGPRFLLLRLRRTALKYPERRRCAKLLCATVEHSKPARAENADLSNRPQSGRFHGQDGHQVEQLKPTGAAISISRTSPATTTKTVVH